MACSIECQKFTIIVFLVLSVLVYTGYTSLLIISTDNEYKYISLGSLGVLCIVSLASLHAAVNYNSSRLFLMLWINIAWGVAQAAGHFAAMHFDFIQITSSQMEPMYMLLGGLCGLGAVEAFIVSLLQYLMHRNIDKETKSYKSMAQSVVNRESFEKMLRMSLAGENAEAIRETDIAINNSITDPELLRYALQEFKTAQLDQESTSEEASIVKEIKEVMNS